MNKLYINKNYNFSNNSSVYFIGIGGAGIYPIAKYLINEGFSVAGSDIIFNNNCKILSKIGAKINIGHDNDTLKKYDVVVYSSAINSDCSELLLAKTLNKPIFKRAEFLGGILDNFQKVIAVSGSHGKTTTTALICEIFSQKYKVTPFIGGNYELKPQNDYKHEIAIVEACEYEKNFLFFKATDVIILNIDKEHVDTYKTIDEQISAFKQFADGAFSIKNGDDENSKSIKSSLTVGLSEKNDLTAKKIKITNKTLATIYLFNSKLFKIKINGYSSKILTNYLSAIAIALKYGIPIKDIKKSIKSFNGVKRRNEYIGRVSRYRYYADYAHHPSEIDCFVNGFYKKLKGKTLVVFEPHTYSRTKELMQEFVSSLSKISDLVIYKTYPARERYSKSGSGIALYENVIATKQNNVYYADDFECVLNYSKDYKNVVILGAGSLYEECKSKINFK